MIEGNCNQDKIERRTILKIKRLKGFQWNIQQSAGQGIPEIVLKEIKKVNADFGIVTKYSKNAKNRYDFEKAVEGLNYNTYCTNAPIGQYDVLIFVSKEFESGKAMEFICDNNNDFPNYLEVLIRGAGFELTVVGTRIRVICNGKTEQERKFRIAQMENLNKRLERIDTPCVVLGDFNGREKWMNTYITAGNYHLCKTNGDTFNFNKFSVVIDHAVVKGVKAKVHTSWSFVETLPDIYKDGPFSSNIPTPYPDHAQLFCDVLIDC